MLITLVIIGVVAALTIPNLMQKYQEQATIKKVQKFYSTLSNAYSLALKENGTISEWNLIPYTPQGSTDLYNILFKPYFKIAKDCGVNNNGNCIDWENYKYLNNNSVSYNAQFYKITLEDGSAVWFHIASETVATETIFKAGVHYDINGINKPNQWGKDVFGFRIVNDGIVPLGLPSGKYALYPFGSTCNTTGSGNNAGTGFGCAAWVVYKGNMDYLHCDGLKWTSRSCKEK